VTAEIHVGDRVQIAPVDLGMSEAVGGQHGRVSVAFGWPFGFLVDLDQGERVAVGRQAIVPASRAKEADRG
jgi:hypothetical protein